MFLEGPSEYCGCLGTKYGIKRVLFVLINLDNTPQRVQWFQRRAISILNNMLLLLLKGLHIGFETTFSLDLLVK